MSYLLTVGLAIIGAVIAEAADFYVHGSRGRAAIISVIVFACVVFGLGRVSR